MPEQPKYVKLPDDDYAIHPRLGVPKQVAWALGAGVLGIVVGGALVGLGAAVAVPAIRDRLRKRPHHNTGSSEPPPEG